MSVGTQHHRISWPGGRLWAQPWDSLPASTWELRTFAVLVLELREEARDAV